MADLRQPRSGFAPDLEQTRRDPAQGLPDSAERLIAGSGRYQWQAEPGLRGRTGALAMKRFVGWAMSATVIVAATAAGAQALPPDQMAGSPPATTVSDFGGPYAAMPPAAPMPGGYDAPRLLPPQEVYTVLRDNGFSPLGAPRQRGFVYTIAVIDRGGADGRLVIDARNGRILRFVPAYLMGARMGDEVALAGPPGPPLFSDMRRIPRPPAPVPHVASRSPAAVPLPKPTPRAVAEPRPETPQAATPAPAPSAPVQQSASIQPKPAETLPPRAAPAPAAPKPSVQILPTQQMPNAQGLD
jgi:hypothetical protein